MKNIEILFFFILLAHFPAEGTRCGIRMKIAHSRTDEIASAIKKDIQQGLDLCLEYFAIKQTAVSRQVAVEACVEFQVLKEAADTWYGDKDAANRCNLFGTEQEKKQRTTACTALARTFKFSPIDNASHDPTATSAL